jgi:hypothetical protein
MDPIKSVMTIVGITINTCFVLFNTLAMNISKILILTYVLIQLLIIAFLFRTRMEVDRFQRQR